MLVAFLASLLLPRHEHSWTVHPEMDWVFICRCGAESVLVPNS